ncbi:uncharacterized protein AMSG_08053 [Thecamonas trahens ATCC 50062]|uniref:Uncharacterized protein n=1 Tax=Thecamonas trahens ATCC 50062 TaxID=461836 RepID=A0A0L0DM73_THETB|nr:hypothetical protein AMSG_08053 [Thecamonas trahens ATCC 50062]KNC52493.1 hypothetical protein AMSG_08053 [Thecamonas trahens ATCC 50062]|eukprot:XP_013755289.1 hypothetical protein AMSG_08053 [Thecamonas trahens ATCC 50062]
MSRTTTTATAATTTTIFCCSSVVVVVVAVLATAASASLCPLTAQLPASAAATSLSSCRIYADREVCCPEGSASAAARDAAIASLICALHCAPEAAVGLADDADGRARIHLCAASCTAVHAACASVLDDEALAESPIAFCARLAADLLVAPDASGAAAAVFDGVGSDTPCFAVFPTPLPLRAASSDTALWRARGAVVGTALAGFVAIAAYAWCGLPFARPQPYALVDDSVFALGSASSSLDGTELQDLIVSPSPRSSSPSSSASVASAGL